MASLEEWAEYQRNFRLKNVRVNRMRHVMIRESFAEALIPFEDFDPIIHRQWEEHFVEGVDPDAVEDSEVGGDLSDLTVNELRQLTTNLGLSSTGNKAELIERLQSSQG